jgi:Mor family transcriptional regulator
MPNPATQTTPPDTPALAIIAREVASAAASFGIACPCDLAQSVIERIVKRIGGQKIYIPSETAAQARRRSALIRAQFNGSNYAELARLHKLTPRQVRNITETSIKAASAPAA